ncbi:MAG: FAD-dependent oxidoreductase [Thermodesulfobacteriota bacterium]
MKYPNLFKPGRIGKVETKNRLVMAPMGTPAMTGFRGTFSDRLLDYYERRAIGGIGLIITGVNLINSKVEPWEAGGEPSLVTFDEPWKVRNFLQLTERIHDQGTKVFAQLTAGFGRVLPKRILSRPGVQPLAPSPVAAFWRPEITAREMTREEIETLVKSFGQAARIAQMGGFDGIEMHGHEGYLLDQFMTSLWNQRSDAYGGTYENRLRFALECIQSIRQAAGPDFPISYRVGLEHKLPGGRTLEEGIRIARDLEKAGVAALHVDAGCYDNWYWPHPPLYQPPGCMVDMAEAVRPHVSIPVITVGRLGYPALADQILAQGKADFVALGRPLLAESDFARKARQGADDQICPCIGCHYCMERMHQNQSMSCAVNPECGDERRLALSKTTAPRRIMVIGGGVAGMEAARVCAQRGHSVALYEKSARLGGILNIASASSFKQDLQRLLQFKLRQLQGLANLVVHTNTEVGAEDIRGAAPDVVFIATGSSPIQAAAIAGLGQAGWVMPDDIYRGSLPEGEQIVVIGGGAVGCEAALHLAREHKKVTIVEMLPALAPDLFLANRTMLLEELKKAAVRIMVNTIVDRVSAEQVHVTRGPEKIALPAEAIVLAIGRKADDQLAAIARELVDEVHVIGDCLSPRKIKDAIWEAYKIGRVI